MAAGMMHRLLDKQVHSKSPRFSHCEGESDGEESKGIE